MKIRAEVEGDLPFIELVTVNAFESQEFSSHTEQFIVNALRKNKKLSVSLVAEINGNIVGHIAFSPVSISDDSVNWYGLGPVSVGPDFQNNGIGSKLITEGIASIKSLGAIGCVVLGDPDYYGRFGFKVTEGLIFKDAPKQYFQVKKFIDNNAQGLVTYDIAFEADC